MTNKEKFELAESITLKEVIDQLTDCVVTGDWLDTTHRGLHYNTFDHKPTLFPSWFKEVSCKYATVKLKLDQLFFKILRDNDLGYSKNAIKKCNSREEIVKMAAKRYAKKLYFQVAYDHYFALKEIIVPKGSNFYSKDIQYLIDIKKKEYSEFEKQILDLQLQKINLERKIKKLEYHQSVYNEICRLNHKYNEVNNEKQTSQKA